MFVVWQDYEDTEEVENLAEDVAIVSKALNQESSKKLDMQESTTSTCSAFTSSTKSSAKISSSPVMLQ